MDTLVREDTTAPAPDAAAPPETAAAAEPATRACGSCGAAMIEGQDWCLECGTAAPGRLGRRPGMRAALTVAALTVVLVCGAVTAGYAALSGDAGRDVVAAAGPDAAPITQPPPSVPAAPPAPVEQPTQPLNTVKPPKQTSTPPPAPITSTPPPAVVTPPPATNTGTTPPPADTTPDEPTLTAIKIAPDGTDIYDPYANATAKGDPVDAIDHDGSTAWKVTTAAADPPTDMQVGYLVDLGSKQAIKQLQLVTRTPGFRIELYAADSKALPPDILDTRWAHLTNKRNVGVKNDGKETIDIGGGTHEYRYVLVWLTIPPSDGPTVKINELKLLG